MLLTVLGGGEIRIQFRESGNYEYHPSVCCVPDSHVEEAITSPKAIGIIDNSEKLGMENVEWLLKISENVAEYFSIDRQETTTDFWELTIPCQATTTTSSAIIITL